MVRNLNVHRCGCAVSYEWDPASPEEGRQYFVIGVLLCRIHDCLSGLTPAAGAASLALAGIKSANELTAAQYREASANVSATWLRHPKRVGTCSGAGTRPKEIG